MLAETNYKDWEKDEGLDTREYKRGRIHSKRIKSRAGGNDRYYKGIREEKMNENDEHMKQGAHQKGQRGTEMASLEEGATREKGPRRTVRREKARPRTEGTGGEKETG